MLRKETKIFENDFDAATANDLASSSLDLANVFYEDTGVENNEYAYDANGNQITKTAESKTEINTYDGLNQLIGFTDGETTASYKYNADDCGRVRQSTARQSIISGMATSRLLWTWMTATGTVLRFMFVVQTC